LIVTIIKIKEGHRTVFIEEISSVDIRVDQPEIVIVYG